jgi:hypothetical protein
VALKAADWGYEVDWSAGSVGPYLSVLISRQSIEAWLAKQPSQAASQRRRLKKAPSAEIDLAIQTAYDNAQREGRKPPNINELPDEVLPILEAKHYRASKLRIKERGEQDKFSSRRRLPGRTWESEHPK